MFQLSSLKIHAQRITDPVYSAFNKSNEHSDGGCPI